MISGLKFTENSWLFAKYKSNMKNPRVTRYNPYICQPFSPIQVYGWHWMHMLVDSMYNRLLGLQRNKMATKCFLKASCVILMPHIYYDIGQITASMYLHISSVSSYSIPLIFCRNVLSTQLNKMLEPEFLLTPSGLHNPCRSWFCSGFGRVVTKK